MPNAPRDPARIDRILQRLRRLWRSAPDLRLCQLLYCLTRTGEDPFNLEDDRLEERLEAQLESRDLGLHRQPPPVIEALPDRRLVRLNLGPEFPEILASPEWAYLVATQLDDAAGAAQVEEIAALTDEQLVQAQRGEA